MYEEARDIYMRIKEKAKSSEFRDQVAEFENALENLITEYDTADWENRFVVGGVLEILFCALLNSMGFKCQWLKEARYDIEINGVKFSIKSNFTGSGDIRLINILGNKEAEWKEPTLFFISNFGICYVDPAMGLSTKQTNDALVTRTSDVTSVVKEDDKLKVKIPRKPVRSKKIKTASYDVVKSILEEIKSKHLKEHLPEA